MSPKWTKYIPHDPFPKQRAWLLSNHVEELFYGGAGGGGKSDVLLMGALQYVDTPNYAALILRRSYPELSQPGAIMDRAHQWLAQTDAKWDNVHHKYRFPSGAVIQFGYLQSNRDKFRYQSAEYQYVAFDEVTGFHEKDYSFLFTRCRKTKGMGLDHVPIRVRSGSNPGDIGHQWVKKRFVDPRTREPGAVFLPAKLTDNPHLSQEEYLSALSHTDPVTRKRIVDGDWDILEEGEMFKRTWFPRVDDWPRGEGVQWVRFWDFAGTKYAGKGDPDYTAGVLMCMHQGQFWIVDAQRHRESPKTVEDIISTQADYDIDYADPITPRIRIEKEPGASGSITEDHYRRNVVPGYSVRFQKPSTNLVERSRPLSSAAEARNVNLVRGSWNEPFLDELCSFPTPSMHDDWVSASSGAHASLAKPPRRRIRARSVGSGS